MAVPLSTALLTWLLVLTIKDVKLVAQIFHVHREWMGIRLAILCGFHDYGQTMAREECFIHGIQCKIST